MIVGDLHIGWEASLLEQGIRIPSQTPKLIEKLRGIIEINNVANLLILGDVKHTVERVKMVEWHEIPNFFNSLLDIVNDISVVPGNHDGNLEALVPRGVRILPTSGLTFNGRVGAIHGHAWPRPDILRCENIIMAHLHPVITVTDTLGCSATYRVWLRATSKGVVLAKSLLRHLKVKLEGDVESTMKGKFNVTVRNAKVTFLPAFNDLLSGQAVNRSLRNTRHNGVYFGPLLRSGGILLEEGDVYLLDGSYLGKLKSLWAQQTS
ncbi:MAG: metallophosphoesterase [Candidatus Bathyarchaeia archaeon]